MALASSARNASRVARVIVTCWLVMSLVCRWFETLVDLGEVQLAQKLRRFAATRMLDPVDVRDGRVNVRPFEWSDSAEATAGGVDDFG